MYRKRSRKTAVILFLFLLIWVPVCLSAGMLIALRSLGAAASPKETVASPSSDPTPDATPTTAPLKITAAYRAFGTGLRLRGKEPKILIYHTHTNEAYFPTEAMPYRESSRWRTADKERSVVAVGERLKTVLERDYGYSVLHDTTDHEPPKLSTAYERSEQTMLTYLEKYPSLEVFIDLHRDAYGNDPKAPADYITVNGEQVARLMFVVGRGEAYADKPFYETNRRFAERMTAYLNSIDPSFARPIREKKGRYNQHVGAYCLLIEVGHNANTLEQALAAVPYLAEAIAYASAETEHAVTSWVPGKIEN